MQRIKRSTSPSVFSSYFEIINHVHEISFSKYTFKRTRWFLKIYKISDKLPRPKIRGLSPRYWRKNLVTTIFFEQRIKEKLSIWQLIFNLITTFGSAVCCILLYYIPTTCTFKSFFISSFIKLWSLHFYFELTTRDFTLEN